MVYYYQVRNHHYKTEAVPSTTCPLCGTHGHMKMSILQKYTWMIGPMAPSRKYAIAWCESCNQYIPRVKWTDGMDAEYVRLKEGLKTPARLYRGMWVMPLILVAFIGTILGIVSFTSGRQKNRTAFVDEATMKPQVGDIFQVNLSQGQNTSFAYYRVARTTNDSVYMQESTHRAPDMEHWDEIPTDPANYKAEQKPFSLSQAKEMNGMFSNTENGMPAYALVFGVWRDGELHKKY